ncbi:MAG: c-type cytochrome [bacterium]
MTPLPAALHQPKLLWALAICFILLSGLLSQPTWADDDDNQQCYSSANKYLCDDDDDDDDHDGDHDHDDDHDDDDHDHDHDDDYDDDKDHSSSSRNTQIRSVIPVNLANATQFIANHGRLLAAQCAQCHGMNGYTNTSIDHLAGESVAEIVEEMLEMQLEAENDMMHVQARGYTYEEIQAMAQYFASLPRSLPITIPDTSTNSSTNP